MTPQVTHQESPPWTAVDLVDRFGPVPLSRVRLDPPPGAAAEEDVVAIHDREERLFELVDGILLEKTASTYEAWLAMRLGRLLGNHVEQHNLGLVLGADGMLRGAGLVRIPDISFISWGAAADSRRARYAHRAARPTSPSRSSAARTRGGKWNASWDEYFDAGTRLVWYVYRLDRQVHVYHGPTDASCWARTIRWTAARCCLVFNFRLTELFDLAPRDGG